VRDELGGSDEREAQNRAWCLGTAFNGQRRSFNGALGALVCGDSGLSSRGCAQRNPCGRRDASRSDATVCGSSALAHLPLPPQRASDTYYRANPQGGLGGTATLVSGLNGQVGHYSAHRWDHRGNIDYHFTSQIMGYAQVSTGFKGGGVNPRPFYASQVLHFNPEILTSYELGLKSSWLDNHVRVNLDGYFSQYRNIQETLLACGFVPSIAALNQGSPCALPYNSGNAHVKGAELETQARFGGFQFDASASYLDFQFVSLLSQLTSTTLAAGTRMTLGMVTPYTPSWQASIGAQYTLPIGSAGSLTTRLDANGRGYVYGNAVNASTNRIGGYTPREVSIEIKHTL